MRRPLALLLAAVLLLPAAPAFPGDREAASPGPDKAMEAQQKAIDRGLRWLAAQQQTNGAFPATEASGLPSSSPARYQTAVTALATLAFLGAGEGLGRGEYRGTVCRAVDWLLDAQQTKDTGTPGYIQATGDDQSKMHGHGFATLALAEAFGTAADSNLDATGGTRDDLEIVLRRISSRLKPAVQAAVDCIERSQSSVGGWDYDPSSGGTTGHEGSVTVCQVQALLAATNRGFHVSLERVKRAREYMRKSQADSGGFRYRLSPDATGQTERLSWSLTAAGLVSLLGLAEYDRKDALDRGFRYLEQRDGRWRPQLDGSGMYPFYGHFYAVQAYHFAGGERWATFWPPVRSRILELQRTGGSWEGQDTQQSLGPVYPTAMCLLMLEVPVGYLSIFAR